VGAATFISLPTLFGFALHPAMQHAADVSIAYPLAKRKEFLALEHRIVGENCAFVVEKLGEPRRVRGEIPTVVTTPTRVINQHLATYQAMDYAVNPVICRATRFIAFVHESGTVTSHRVNREYGQARGLPPRGTTATSGSGRCRGTGLVLGRRR